jgi:osmotically-inducible protein OsmY
MKLLWSVSGLVLVIGLAACTSTDKERAREDAKRAGSEIKADAKELSRGVQAAVQPDQDSASDKMSHAVAEAKDDASKAGVHLDHAAMLAKVKSRLASDAGLSTITNVDVELAGSVVTLSGTVSNDAQKHAAEAAASQVDGVTSVQNHLSVQP